MNLSVNEHKIGNIAFSAKKGEDAPKHDMPLKNNFPTRSRIAIDKFVKAFTVYPARGMKGNINADFYEFLTMGTVPYVIGSLTLMGVFNGVRKAFKIHEDKAAAKIGNKLALGVLFYGVFKNLSKSLINLPVKWKTGIDTQLPYLKVYNELPENKDDTDVTSYEYHKVGESVEFTRWDMLYGKPQDKKILNEKFDRIAKKNGLGEDLNDSDQAVKPMYKEVLVKTSLAKRISSYLWAATGVAIAAQDRWDEFFKSMKSFKPKEAGHTIKLFFRDFKESAKTLYKGSPQETNKLYKHGGKALIWTTIGVTMLGLLNAMHVTRKPSKVNESDVMNKNKESVVG